MKSVGRPAYEARSSELRALRNSAQNKSKTLWKKALGVITDKDLRATTVWWSSGFGLLMIGGYFLWLGFTPVFGLGQASLLLLQAFLVGLCVTVYFAFALFIPAFFYRVLDLEVDDFPKPLQAKAIDSLTLRSMAAQACAISLLFLCTTLVTFEIDSEVMAYVLSALAIFLSSAVILLKLPRTSMFGRVENWGAYLGSILALGISGLLGMVMLFTMYTLPLEKDRAGPSIFIVALAILVVTSAVIGTLRKAHRWVGFLIAGILFVFLLAWFNSVTMPFKATAVRLGIAVPWPAELILPAATCELVRHALTNKQSLNCEGPDAGRLRGIHVLNTLGERWVIREADSEENIIFEGKGIVVHRLSAPN